MLCTESAWIGWCVSTGRWCGVDRVDLVGVEFIARSACDETVAASLTDHVGR